MQCTLLMLNMLYKTEMFLGNCIFLHFQNRRGQISTKCFCRANKPTSKLTTSNFKINLFSRFRAKKKRRISIFSLCIVIAVMERAKKTHQEWLGAKRVLILLFLKIFPSLTAL